MTEMEPTSGVHMPHDLTLIVHTPQAGENSALKPVAS